MSINFNHVTNDITASSGSVSINGSVPGGGGASAITISNKTAAYTVVAGDLGRIINCTSNTFTISLTAAATLGSGFNCWVWNTSGSDNDKITIDPAGTETIDGVTTLVICRGEGMQIVSNGTNWETNNKKPMRGYAESLSAGNQRPSATGNNAVAIHSWATASGPNSLAIGQFANASGQGATAIGTNSNVNGSQALTGAGAMALGGSYASGTDSFAAAVANNTSSYGATAANNIAIGYLSRASSTRGLALGYTAVASNVGTVALGGYAYGAQATGIYAVAIGDGATASGTASGSIGWYNTVSGVSSLVLGCENQGVAVAGKLSWGPSNSPGSGPPAGNPRSGHTVITCSTTDATPRVLVVASATGNDPASATNQVVLPNNSAFAFSALIVARRQASGGTQSAAWKIEGLIRREGSAATTTLVNSATTVLDNTPGWTIAVSADTTNGGLAITATGAAATNIRWVATVQTSEVTYA